MTGWVDGDGLVASASREALIELRKSSSWFIAEGKGEKILSALPLQPNKKGVHTDPGLGMECPQRTAAGLTREECHRTHQNIRIQIPLVLLIKIRLLIQVFHPNP